MLIEFFKYQGTGNDFILIDDRENIININDYDLIAALCERRMGIGADGLILLRKHEKYDFEMIYFNSDGNQSSMCGNGGRCIVLFAEVLGIIENEAEFMAIDGVHKAKIDNDIVYLKMQDVTKVEVVGSGIFLNTGSPHYIEMVDNLEGFDVVKQARKIRNSSPFKEEGVNVNFVLDSDDLELRTYERGVEAETLSCGTGAVATAIAMHHANCLEEDSVYLKTKGGVLGVSFEFFKGFYRNIWLSGEVNMVYAGEFEC